MKAFLFFTLITFFINAYSENLYWLSEPKVDLLNAVNDNNSSFTVSSNGAYLAFPSLASNWVSDDTNNFVDVIVSDIDGNSNLIASSNTDGSQWTTGAFRLQTRVSDDGSRVLMLADTIDVPGSNGSVQIYLKDLNSGLLTLESETGSGNPLSISGQQFLTPDGRYMIVATATNIDMIHLENTLQVYRKDLDTDAYELLSTASNQTEIADASAELIDVSPNANYLLLRTDADNLVGPLDQRQLITKDLNTGAYTLVSIQPDGMPSDLTTNALRGRISDTGAVVFISNASDLVDFDTNGERDLFYFDGSEVVRVSTSNVGVQISDPALGDYHISPDGQFIVFVSKSNEIIPGSGQGFGQPTIDPVLLYETTTSQLSLINSTGSGPAEGFVVGLEFDQNNTLWMQSTQYDLPGLDDSPLDESNVVIHQYDIDTQLFTRSMRVANPSKTVIADVDVGIATTNQRFVLTSSESANLAPDQDRGNSLILQSRYDNTSQVIGRRILPTNFTEKTYDISPSGRYIGYISKYFQPEGIIELAEEQVFLYDRINQSYTQVTNGSQLAVNDEGLVAFETEDQLVGGDQNDYSDIYLFDSSSSQITLLSKNPSTNQAGNSASFSPDIGGAGDDMNVVFTSGAEDLTGEPDDTFRDQIFVYQSVNDAVIRVSENNGSPGGRDSDAPSISNDGAVVVFRTQSINLTDDDYTSAGARQIIRHDLMTQENSLASINRFGLPIGGSVSAFSSRPAVSDTGRYVTYSMSDIQNTNDFAFDDDRASDVILFDTLNGSAEVISDFGQSGANTQNAFNTTVVENPQFDPPLLGVLFNSGGQLSGVDQSTTNDELYMFQKGGLETDILIHITGNGSVTGSLGINCSGECEYVFSINSNVSMVAQGDPGFEFYRWNEIFDDCESTNPSCGFELDDRPREFDAVFLPVGEIIFRSGFE